MRTSPITFRARALSSSLALVGAAIFIQACGSSAPDTAPATGGSVGATTGGSAATTGGTATGGTATGGAATGGTATGGTATTTGGTSSGGIATTGGAATGGTVSTGGQPSGGGGSSGASASGGNAGAAGANAGTGGGASGAAGTSGGGAGGATATGGSGGKGGAGGSAGGAGGSGGTGAGKTAVATLAPTSGNQLTGTGTFTQTGQSVTLVIQVTNCPVGSHASHIHLNKNCGSNGDDAGAHWVPQGEVLPDIVCAADGTGTATVTPPNGAWTIGTGGGDVTVHALMVHTGNMSNPGGRIACGLINAQ